MQFISYKPPTMLEYFGGSCGFNKYKNIRRTLSLVTRIDSHANSGAGNRIETLRVVEISARASTRGTRAGARGKREGEGEERRGRRADAAARETGGDDRIRIATVVRTRSHDVRIYGIMQM